MPPDIWEIVQEAGAQNVLYYSDRWRRSTKPPVGDAAAEMPNTIPGSEITATQGTASAQPISHNRGYSFEGDDHLVSSGHRPDFDGGVTLFFVVDNRASGTNTVLASQSINTARDDPSFDVRLDGGTQVDSRFHDGVTDLRPTIGDIDNTTLGIVVARTQITGGTFSANLWYANGDGVSTQAAQTASTESGFSADVRHIGQRVTGGNGLDALVGEVLTVEQALSDARIEATIDRMRWRHRI